MPKIKIVSQPYLKRLFNKTPIMNMTILNHQNGKTGGRNVLVINGELSEYRGSEEHRKVQNLTMPSKTMKKQKFFSWLCRLIGASPSFCIYYNKRQGVIMTSNLISKDEIGRRLSYQFYCDTIDNPYYVRRLFEDYCSIASVIPDKKDCAAIEKLLHFKKNRNKYIAIIVTLLVAIVSIKLIISSITSNSNSNERETIEASSMHHES